MYLHEQINQSIIEWPLLFKDKNIELSTTKVIDHLFTTSGGGYGWYDGYLVNLDKPTKCRWDAKIMDYVVIKALKYGEIRYSKKADETFFSKDIAESMNVGPFSFTIPQVSHQPFEPSLTSGGNILRLPKNIRVDWLAGASKILKIIEVYYEKHPENEFLDPKNYNYVVPHLRRARQDVNRLMKKTGIDGKNEDDVILSVIP